MSEFQTILVPYDYSTHADEALALAVKLARTSGADLVVIYVAKILEYPFAFGEVGQATNPPLIDRDMLIKSAREALDRKLADIEAPGAIRPVVIESHDIAETLVEQAKAEHADLIVMGTHGYGGLSRLFLGSVAERTLRTAHCPVLTTRAPETE